MRLGRIEPGTPDHDKRIFEYELCGNVMVETVKYRWAAPVWPEQAAQRSVVRCDHLKLPFPGFIGRTF